VAAAVVPLVGAPGLASATTSHSYGSVAPLLDCVARNDHGTITAVLGYSNTTGRTQTIPIGVSNSISPSKYNGQQPTTFRTGTQHGVFSVRLTAAEAWSNPSWTVNGRSVNGWTGLWAKPCPPDTTMPSSGNGTGAAIALGAAGVIGVLFIRRFLRRTTRVTPTASVPSPEAQDA
jgi:hypothetical protein